MPRVWPAASWPVLTFPSGDQSRFTIGRDSGCDMVLPDPTVSRWHAGLRREPGGWLLDDLGSTNGTLAQRVAGRGPGSRSGTATWSASARSRSWSADRPGVGRSAAADPVESMA